MTDKNTETPATAATLHPQDEPNKGSTGTTSGPTPSEPETFSREYVEKLRKEAADHRVKAKDRDDLARPDVEVDVGDGGPRVVAEGRVPQGDQGLAGRFAGSLHG